jgi:hypothetical protein
MTICCPLLVVTYRKVYKYYSIIISMKTLKEILEIGKVLWPFLLLGCNGNPNRYKTPEEVVRHYQQDRAPITRDFLVMYAKDFHKGVEKWVGESQRDFDKDGVDDEYILCKDGSVLSRLSKLPSNDFRNTHKTDFWYDIGVQTGATE